MKPIYFSLSCLCWFLCQVLDGLLAQHGTVENVEQGKENPCFPLYLLTHVASLVNSSWIRHLLVAVHHLLYGMPNLCRIQPVMSPIHNQQHVQPEVSPGCVVRCCTGWDCHVSLWGHKRMENILHVTKIENSSKFRNERLSLWDPPAY